MKYVSIDIETSGLDSVRHQILEFAAVLWLDDGPIMEQPYFRKAVRQYGDIIGDPFALVMNMDLLREISTNKCWTIDNILSNFTDFLSGYGVTPENRVQVIGKNFASFDLQFLKYQPNWPSHLISHRVLDVGSLYATPDGVPSTSGIPSPSQDEVSGNSHEALYDARVSLWQAREKFKKNLMYVLTRSGERGTLGVFSSEELLNEAIKNYSHPEELEVDYVTLDHF